MSLPGWPGLRGLTTDDPSSVLDLDESIGQRSSTFTFELVDGVSGILLGYVTPIREAASITHDTSRTVKRELRIDLGVSDTAAINPITDRIMPRMIIGGQTWDLGRFMFADETDLQSTGGTRSTLLLLDEMNLIDQQISEGFTSTTVATAAVLELLAGLPLVGINLEPSPYPAAVSAQAGTNRGQILEALATQGDMMTPWMDNHGLFRMIRTVDPDTATPTLDFDRGNRVIRSTIADTSDLLTAPNRFVVISNSGEALAAAVYGVYDVPPTAPYSISARGFVIPQVMNLQVATSAQAAAMARNIGIRQSVFQRTQLSTAPDPRHDSYDVIRWQGVNWLELGWSMTLRDGAPMTHTLRRSFM